MLTFGSLFSGIGGFDLGFERAGFRCVWQVEKDKFCRRVLRKHWPDAPQWDDVTTFTGEGFERPDCIIGGFPCQDLSMAGARAARAGLEGDRSGLWWEFARVIRLLRPRYVCIENVPGILVPVASGRPAPFGCVLGELARLGFDAEWSVISGCSVGAPHVRRRLFLIAYANGQLGKTRVRVQQHDTGRQTVSAIIHREGNRARKRWMETVCSNGGSNDGVSNWVDRARALGNAVVPQVAEVVAKRLLEIAGRIEPE